MATAFHIRAAAPAKRNVIASALSNGCFRQQKVQPKAGKGAYKRKPKHNGRSDW